MSRWRCPACDREFDRARQSHVCVPGCTVEECFAGRPPGQRAIYDLLEAHLRTLGPLHVDAVRVGVFLKHQRKLAEVRPKSRWLSLEVVLPRPVEDPRVARRERIGPDRIVHVVKLSAVEDVDEPVLAWLGEAYDAAA